MLSLAQLNLKLEEAVNNYKEININLEELIQYSDDLRNSHLLHTSVIYETLNEIHVTKQTLKELQFDINHYKILLSINS